MATRKSELVITCNAKAVKDVFEYLNRQLADVKQSLKDLNKRGEENGWTEEMKKEFKELTRQATAIDSAIIHNQATMVKYGQVMQDLAHSKLRDVRSALGEVKRAMNGMSEDDPKRAKLNKDLARLAEQIDVIGDKKVTLEQTLRSLKDLGNTSLSKLKQGLEAVRRELETEPSDTQWSDFLQKQELALQAQIAIAEYGKIGKAPATGSLRSEDRLRAEAERSRLISAYQAASLSEDKGHQAWAANALREIQQYNSALQALTETERKDAQMKAEQKRAADALAAANKTMTAIANNQKVTIQELADAQKYYETELQKMEGLNLTAQDQQKVDMLKTNLETVKATLRDISEIEIRKVIDNIDDQKLETLEATLKRVKEDAAQFKLGQDTEIKDSAEDIEKLTQAIEKFKDKMAGIDQLDFDHLENIPTEKLEAALDRISEKEKKLASVDRAAAQQMAANKTKLQNQINKNKQATIDFANAEQVANERGKHSVVEMQAAYDALKQKLINLRAEETEAIRTTRKQMDGLKDDINKVKGDVTGLTKVWRTAIRNIGTYVGVFAGFNFVKGKLEDVIKKNYELSDSLTNVRKVSGLTMNDINQLYTNIAKIDTRNTINTLTNLAYQGGKLGIQEYGGIEALTGFVTAAEQVQAALGEDLGEDALPALAKLTENMGLIKSMGVEQAMQKTASAIFALSTSSVSTGQGIVDFSKRLMPVAKSANVATSELLGLASATESSGLAAEVAATAFVKMFPSIYKNADALETYLGISKGVIHEMYDQNRAMDAMVMIFDKMQDMGNLNKYPEIFKLLGSEGARMNTVMSAMANNVDMLRTHLNTSNKAFEEGTAVINEYMLQTNSAAGILERANNIWEKAFVNPEGVDMVKELAEMWYLLSKHVANSDTWMTAFRTSLGIIEKIIATLIVLLPVLARLMMFVGIANALKYITTNFWDMRKAIIAAAGAQGKLNAAMRANMFGILVGLGLSLISCFWDLYKIIEKDAAATKKLTQEEQDLADAEKMVTDYTKKEVGHLNALYKAATDTLQPMEKRMQWVKQLKQEFPDYFKDLSDEAILTGKAADKYEALAQSLMKAAKARAYKDKMEKISEESVQLQEEIDNDLDYLTQNEKRYKEEKKKQQERDDITSYGGAVFAGEAALQGHTKKLDTFVDQYEETEDRVIKKQAQIGQNDQRIKNLAAKAMENTPTPKPVEFEPGGGGGGAGGGTGELNAEYRNEQQKVKDIINKVKNYYQRQINSINDMAAVGTIDEQQQRDMVEGMQQRMNEALSQARKAIGGVENDWEEFRQTMINDLYEPLNKDGKNWSTDLVSDIVDNDLVQLRAMIQKLSDALKKNGAVLLEEILRKSTEDEGKNIDIANKRMRERQQELRRKNYTEQVDYDYIQRMGQFGIGTPTAEQDIYIREMSKAGNKDAIKKFFDDRNTLWREGFANARENLLAVIDSDVQTAEGRKSILEIMYGQDYETRLKDMGLESLLSMQLDQWQIFYQKLIEMSDAWDNAQKKTYEENKKLEDFRFNNDATTLEIKAGVTQMETRVADRKWRGADQGENFSQMAGFTNINEDPELVRLMLLEEQAQRYYDKMEELRQRDLVSQEMVDDAKASLADAEKNRQQEIMNLINEHISKLNQWVDPIEQFGSDVGAAMGNALNGTQSMAEGMQDALKKVVQAWGQSTIDIVKQLMMQQVKQKLIGKAMGKQAEKNQEEQTEIAEEGGKRRMEAENIMQTGLASITQQMGQQILSTKAEQDQQETQMEGQKARGGIMAGIAEGAAKIIGSLGWWGIPLVAVITALLNGLLSMALNALFGGSSSANNNANASQKKIKLASGMLTYDEGNVQTVVGDDGRVYRAREQRSLPDGVKMISEPIATTVNGQQALVGERGPEIVIGRKTTRAIQMNRPDLLRDLAMIDRGITTRKVRTFDEGNLSDMASAFAGQLPATQQGQQGEGQTIDAATSEALRQMPAAMAAFAEVMTVIQKQGIPSYIKKYGTGGLIDEVQSGLKFVSKYK